MLIQDPFAVGCMKKINYPIFMLTFLPLILIPGQLSLLLLFYTRYEPLSILFSKTELPISVNCRDIKILES